MHIPLAVARSVLFVCAVCCFLPTIRSTIPHTHLAAACWCCL